MAEGSAEAGTGSATALRRWLPTRWLPTLGALPFVLLALSPAIVSYDDHVEPCRRILDLGRLPAPEDCWECHQPPLYYLLGAGLLAVARAVSGALSPSLTFTTLKLLGLFLSLGTLSLLALLVRRFFPEEPGRQALVLGLLLVTPRFVLSGVMMGNDAAVLCVATLALYLAVREADAGPERSLWRAWGVGAAAGAAVLAKYNAFALLPGAGAAALWPWWARRESGRRAAGRLAVVAAAFLVVAGPWFVRNQLQSGTPIPTRMARVEDIETSRYRLFDLRPFDLLRTPFVLEERVRPGETLPYRQHQELTPADTSLWTKTYALWWADALYYLPQPPAWLTATRYVAAFPVCLLALLGLVLGLWRLVRSRAGLHSAFGCRTIPPDGVAHPLTRHHRCGGPVSARALGRRQVTDGAALPDGPRVAPLVLVPVLLALYFAFVARYPWVRMGHGRASFLLPLLAPFGLCFGLGWEALRARWPGRAVRVAAWALFGVLIASCVAYEGFLVAHYLL